VAVFRVAGLVVGRGRLFEKVITGPVHPKGTIPKLRNPGAAMPCLSEKDIVFKTLNCYPVPVKKTVHTGTR
jgi:hypothetical protein